MEVKVFNKKGFTMIEMITGIAIISIISVVVGMSLVQIGNAYLLTKKSTAEAQQAQIVLVRLFKELSAIESISPATATSITYFRNGDSHILTWIAADQPLTLDGDILIDKVQAFSLTYYTYDYTTQTFTADSYSSATAMIELIFQLKGYGNIPLIFVKRVAI